MASTVKEFLSEDAAEEEGNKNEISNEFIPTVRREGNRTYFDHRQMELARLRAELRLSSYIVQLSRRKLRPNFPNIWNGLKPYGDTYCPEFMQSLPNDTFVGGKSRLTVQNVVDPEEGVRIDQTKVTLPEINITRRQMLTQLRQERSRLIVEDDILDPRSRPLPWTEKQGSTGLTPFAKVKYRRPEIARRKGIIDYTDVPLLRRQTDSMYSTRLIEKQEIDFRRTVDDFYRMDLNVARNRAHPLNRFLLDQACLTYFGPSRGSIRAYKKMMKMPIPMEARNDIEG